MNSIKLLLVALALSAAVAFGSVVELTDENFDSIVLDESKDVFVKFYAPWCGHCVHMAPKWKELAVSQAGSPDVVIAELDADKHTKAAQRHDIRGFPTIKLFTKSDKSGKLFQGVRDVPTFENFLQENI